MTGQEAQPTRATPYRWSVALPCFHAILAATS
jgi:hypothetical protein